MAERFNYQLTNWQSSMADIQFAIKQIEKYEPHSEGKYYIVKENKNGEVAIFTKGKKI